MNPSTDRALLSLVAPQESMPYRPGPQLCLIVGGYPACVGTCTAPVTAAHRASSYVPRRALPLQSRHDLLCGWRSPNSGFAKAGKRLPQHLLHASGLSKMGDRPARHTSFPQNEQRSPDEPDPLCTVGKVKRERGGMRSLIP